MLQIASFAIACSQTLPRMPHCGRFVCLITPFAGFLCGSCTLPVRSCMLSAGFFESRAVVCAELRSACRGGSVPSDGPTDWRSGCSSLHTKIHGPCLCVSV
jgi:hypothetical protein